MPCSGSATDVGLLVISGLTFDRVRYGSVDCCRARSTTPSTFGPNCEGRRASCRPSSTASPQSSWSVSWTPISPPDRRHRQRAPGRGVLPKMGRLAHRRPDPRSTPQQTRPTALTRVDRCAVLPGQLIEPRLLQHLRTTKPHRNCFVRNRAAQRAAHRRTQGSQQRCSPNRRSELGLPARRCAREQDWLNLRQRL